MRYYRAPGSTPPSLPLDEVKAFLSRDHDFEDYLIQSLSEAAVERAEQETGIVFGESDWIIEGEPSGLVVLPIWPVISVTGILGGETPFTDYKVRHRNRQTSLESSTWPEAVTITVRAGMEMPYTVRQACMMMVGYWYDQRQTASAEGHAEVPYGASALLGLNRRMSA